MRKLFFKQLYNLMAEDPTIVVLTADMGYGLLDSIRDTYKNRFYNVYSAEQLMIGTAAGLALDGYIPVCYSITPFLLYRPFEFIRNYMNHEKIPIKLVGGGRDADYGYLGFTHHAHDDMDIMGQLKNITCYKPESDDLMLDVINKFLYNDCPSYINLKK